MNPKARATLISISDFCSINGRIDYFQCYACDRSVSYLRVGFLLVYFLN
jgi:hypothetical protein